MPGAAGLIKMLLLPRADCRFSAISVPIPVHWLQRIENHPQFIGNLRGRRRAAQSCKRAKLRAPAVAQQDRQWLRIWWCQSCGVGRSCSLFLIPGLDSTCHGAAKKEKQNQSWGPTSDFLAEFSIVKLVRCLHGAKPHTGQEKTGRPEINPRRRDLVMGVLGPQSPSGRSGVHTQETEAGPRQVVCSTLTQRGPRLGKPPPKPCGSARRKGEYSGRQI